MNLPLAVCLLLVVLRKQRVKKWIDRHCSPATLDRGYDVVHHRAGWVPGIPVSKECACPECVSVFEPFMQLARIA